MKRALKIIAIVIGVIIAVIVVFAAVFIVPAFVGRRALVPGVEVNGVHIVKDGIVSIGVIPVGQGQVALIDAGNDKHGYALLAELQRRQLGPDAVVAIMLTHGHPDHTAGLALFPKAQVIALDAEIPLVAGTAGAHGPLTRFMPVTPTGVKVTEPLKDGQTVSIGDTKVQVFAVPGHTQGSAAYLVDGVLFLGDAADISKDGKLQAAPWAFSDSQSQDRASLVRLDQTLMQQNADVKAIECAHSGVLTEGLAPLTEFAQANQ